MKKFFCMCFSATLQRSINFDSIRLESVNRSKSYGLYASGKAVNSARVLEQLEHDCVTTYCPLGVQNQQEFIDLAKADNLNLVYSKIPGKIRECWTLLDSSSKSTTELVVGEPVFKADRNFNDQQKMIKELFLPNLIDENDAVLLAGSRPGIWSNDMYPTLAKYCVENGKIFLADYIGEDLLNTLKVCTPTIIKINDEEFCKTFGLDYPAADNSLRDAIIEKSRQLGNIIVVTRGTASTFGAKNGEFAECPIEKVSAINTTACGDSFNAGFLYEYTNTGDFAAALKKGTWCAARNAESQCPGSILG